MPRLVSVGGLLVGIILLGQEISRRRNRTGVPPGWTKDVTVAARTFVAMGVFLTLVALGGYLAAMLLFVPAFLLYVARARPWVTIAYTLVLGIALLTLPTLLPVDLPTGFLQ